MYVTAYGIDSYGCGDTEMDGCGTLYYASSQIMFEHSAEIIVQGQNVKAIQEAVANVPGLNPCITPISFFHPDVNLSDAAITFDPRYIHTMKDWYNVKECEASTDGEFPHHFVFVWQSSTTTTLTLNNLIIDSYVFEGLANQQYYIMKLQNKFICNSCKFVNITIYSSHHSVNSNSALIIGRDMSFSNCLFENISYIPSSAVDLHDNYQYDFTFIRMDPRELLVDLSFNGMFNFVMKHSVINSVVMLNTFVSLYPYNLVGSLEYIAIESNLFSCIEVVDAIFYHHSALTTSTIDIKNTNFFNLNLGSILHISADHTSIINIDIDNVSVSTAQTVQDYLNTRERIGRTVDNDLYSLFLFESEVDIITINNVKIKYYYSDLLNLCVLTDSSFPPMDWYTLDLLGEGNDGEWWYIVYYCNIPIQFIDSASTVTITDVTVSNDITDIAFESYRDSIINAIHTTYNNPSTIIYLDFVYNFVDYNNDVSISDIAFIYSTGTMRIESLKVYGAGAHYQIVNSAEGSLYIDEMIAIPETYCTDKNADCNYNSDALQISGWIKFGTQTQTSTVCRSGAEFKLSNSFIYGQKNGIAIDINIGYCYLDNVIMQMVSIGIIVSSFSAQFELSSSIMKDIGSYYGSATSYLYALQPAYIPFYFDAKNTIIKDTLFSYVNPYQFDMFDPEYFSSSTADEISTISLINNIFEINDENVLVPYPFPHSLSELNLWSDNNYLSIEQYFAIDGIMVIRDNVDIKLINNVFRINDDNVYVDESILLEEDIPWIYVTNTNGSTCMEGNEFTDFAIFIKKGSITSCTKPDVVNYFSASDCNSYGTFGKTDISSYDDNQRRPNIFNVKFDSYPSGIINVKKGAFVALYNNVINIYELENTVNIMTMENGNYLLIDTVIEASYNTYWYISIKDTCNVHCYSTFNETPHLIPRLHTTCDTDAGIIVNSINDIYEADALSYWTPYLIDIYPDPNGRYFPGDRLKLGYTIYDAYNNQIDAILQDITVTLQSDNQTTLFAQFELYIDSDGFCAACNSGLLFYTVTLDDGTVGKNYSLSAVVNNDQLFVADSIDITIIQCPSGYGASGNVKQCAICNKGYFSLLPTENECLDCNQDITDGILCIGGNHIIIDETYWIAVDGYSDINDNWLAKTNKHILSGKCPPSYCCQLSSGCDFILNDEFLCAKYRDVNAFLCGKCLNGYSELFGTNACAKCSNKYWYRIFIPIVFGLLLSFYIIISVSVKLASAPSTSITKSKCDCLKQKENAKQSDKAMTQSEFMDCLEVMLIKCILYYYQTLSNLLLSTNGVPNALIRFVGLFNFDVLSKISSGNSDDGYCLFSNLNAILKKVIQLTTTLSIIFFVFTEYILLSLSIDILKPLKRRAHYGRAFLKVSFLCVGQILSVLFQLLACRNVGNINVHYFFGSHQCYGFVWIFATICLMVVVLFFIVLFIFIGKKMKAEQPSLKTKAMYHSAIWCYQRKYWYWELVLFVRRLFLAFVLIIFDSNDLRMYTALGLMMYLYIHLVCTPFKYKDANIFEGCLIGATVLVIAIDANYSDNSTNPSANILISLLILFPIFWFIYFILTRCGNLKKDDNIVVAIEFGNLPGNIKSLSASPSPSPMPIEDEDEEKALETVQTDHVGDNDN